MTTTAPRPKATVRSHGGASLSVSPVAVFSGNPWHTAAWQAFSGRTTRVGGCSVDRAPQAQVEIPSAKISPYS